MIYWRPLRSEHWSKWREAAPQDAILPELRAELQLVRLNLGLEVASAPPLGQKAAQASLQKLFFPRGGTPLPPPAAPDDLAMHCTQSPTGGTTWVYDNLFL